MFKILRLRLSTKVDFGEKLYRTKALMPIKVLFLSLCLMLFVNLYLQTYIDPDFLILEQSGFKAIIQFHIRYPEQVLSLFFTTFLPTLYYTFFRGTYFFQKGMEINKGLPFWNERIAYEDIQSYKIIHHKYMMNIKTKTHGDYNFTVKKIDRVVAIFDQHSIIGDLSNAHSVSGITTSRKLAVFYISYAIIITTLQFSGFFIRINQWLFR